MKFLSSLSGMLVFEARALQDQAEREGFLGAVACFCAGFLTYGLVKNHVYADLPEISAQMSGWIHYLLHLNLVQTLFFLLFVYVPGLILLSNSIPGEGSGLLVTRQAYRIHISSLLPLWGLLFLITAPVQWLVPHFLLIDMFEISIGMLVRTILVTVYTVWAVKRLNSLTTLQALAVFILSCVTLPVLFILT